MRRIVVARPRSSTVHYKTLAQRKSVCLLRQIFGLRRWFIVTFLCHHKTVVHHHRMAVHCKVLVVSVLWLIKKDGPA